MTSDHSRGDPLDIDARLRLAGLPPLTRPMWLEIDVPALAGNLAAIRRQVATGTAVWPVVKADGYGHGLEVAARAFLAAGADGVCVATMDEAVALRAAGIDGGVLILYPVPAETADEAASRGFQLVVSTVDGARELADRWVGSGAAARGIRLRVHVEIETGLARMGVRSTEPTAVMARLAVPGLAVTGVWSHLSTPEDPVASAAQEQCLADAEHVARGDGADPRASHLAATGGLLTGRGLAQAMIRPGLIAYGVLPTADPPPFPGLRPAMRLKARAMRMMTVPAGTPVGYGGTWVAARESRIATLPVGYGDGYTRSLSGAPVLLRGSRVPVVGAVAMDALMVDVTDVPDVGPADEFVLLGPQGKVAITALELARWRTTIPWEVLTSMARRTTRVYDAGVGLLGVRTLAGETLVRDAPWS